MKLVGLYIHIPFCKKKCDYCDFISYCDKDNLVEEYIEAVKKEIKESLKDKNCEIETIYIGGGTPSSIDSKYIIDIMDTIKSVGNDALLMHTDSVRSKAPTDSCIVVPKEITIEINPGTITEGKLLEYKKAGINRLSIGLQETNNDLLKQIGRIHTYEEFLETYRLSRKLGFNNINVDLMIGLPNQYIENIKQSLEKIIGLNPEHISVYSLILEEGTKLYERYQNKEIELPDEELERNMYWYVKNTLENNGYIHYEISNFAKMGYVSKHNMNCWNQEEYIGIGAAAHSYINGVRYSNTDNLDKYLKYFVGNDALLMHTDSVRSKAPTDSCIVVPNIKREYKTIHEIQTKEDMQKEYMLLGLRKIEGVSIQKFKNKFGENPIFIFKNELSKLVEENLVTIDGNYIRLTNKGLDLANLVWEEFV